MLSLSQSLSCQSFQDLVTDGLCSSWIARWSGSSQFSLSDSFPQTRQTSTHAWRIAALSFRLLSVVWSAPPIRSGNPDRVTFLHGRRRLKVGVGDRADWRQVRARVRELGTLPSMRLRFVAWTASEHLPVPSCPLKGAWILIAFSWACEESLQDDFSYCVCCHG